MEVLSPKYPGIWFICDQCGAVIANVKDNEIYNDSDVYCPICHWCNQLNYVKSYDGIVKETTVVKEEEQQDDTSQSNNE